MVVVKQILLVTVLPVSRGKSLIFIVLAILSGSGIIIIIILYTELKRQLVTRYTDTGLDCKYWPEVCGSWPRVVLVLAETASSDDFLQWVTDLCIRDQLDRVIIDEYYLTFTTANKYRRKLRELVLLYNLDCLFVFLTGTLPPLY